MAALKTGEEAPVHGAMRVLTEFSRDLTDQHIPQVAPVILPEMYRIFCEEEVRSYSLCEKIPVKGVISLNLFENRFARISEGQ